MMTSVHIAPSLSSPIREGHLNFSAVMPTVEATMKVETAMTVEVVEMTEPFQTAARSNKSPRAQPRNREGHKRSSDQLFRRMMRERPAG
jgi:hypothetical protein